jgi:hypothetical protein
MALWLHGEDEAQLAIATVSRVGRPVAVATREASTSGEHGVAVVSDGHLVTGQFQPKNRPDKPKPKVSVLISGTN